MKLDEVRKYCLLKPGTREDFPFDFTTMVIKVGGKIFLIADVEDNPLRLSLKCEPMYAQSLREQFESIIPGYHLNKQHWNTVILDGTVPGKLVLELIDLSYSLVCNSLARAKKAEIKI